MIWRPGKRERITGLPLTQVELCKCVPRSATRMAQFQTDYGPVVGSGPVFEDPCLSEQCTENGFVTYSPPSSLECASLHPEKLLWACTQGQFCHASAVFWIMISFHFWKNCFWKEVVYCWVEVNMMVWAKGEYSVWTMKCM